MQLLLPARLFPWNSPHGRRFSSKTGVVSRAIFAGDATKPRNLKSGSILVVQVCSAPAVTWYFDARFCWNWAGLTKLWIPDRLLRAVATRISFIASYVPGIRWCTNPAYSSFIYTGVIWPGYIGRCGRGDWG